MDTYKTWVRFVVVSLRRYRVVAAFVALGLSGAGLLVWPSTTQYFVQPPAVIAPTARGVTLSAPRPPLQARAALPVHLSIPAAHISASFEAPLGIQPNGEIDKPVTYTHVAYYQYGPLPGEVGPAVVLGHVDSYQGPGVFYTLGQVVVGDAILIDQANGTRLHFVVEALTRVPQSQFPTGQVYGNLAYAGLRLITCTGTYSHQTKRYDHNLIVSARLVATSTTPTGT